MGKKKIKMTVDKIVFYVPVPKQFQGKRELKIFKRSVLSTVIVTLNAVEPPKKAWNMAIGFAPEG